MAKTTYVWDELSDSVIEEYEDGVLSVSYDHEPGLYGNLLSQNRNGVTSYYHYDGRGDTVALTDDSGNVTDTKEYDAWGNVIASTGSSVTPYQFGGQHGYQTGYSGVYIRARMFQPIVARWESVDPIGFFDGTNRYLPYFTPNGSDPSGLLVIRRQSAKFELKCGEEARIYWDIQLDDPAPCNGYIVQKVQIRCDAVECPCEEFKQYQTEVDTVYFEAWRVAVGETVPRSPKTGDVARFWDTASGPTVLDTCGYNSQTGEVRFYCEDKNHSSAGGVGTGNLGTVVNPGLWKPQLVHGKKCRGRALDLVSTGPEEPKFWKSAPVEAEAASNSSVDRFLTVDWLCCKCAADRVIAFGEP